MNTPNVLGNENMTVTKLRALQTLADSSGGREEKGVERPRTGQSFLNTLSTKEVVILSAGVSVVAVLCVGLFDLVGYLIKKRGY